MVTRGQALAAGLTTGQIRHLVRTGRWHRPYPGTYLVPGARMPRARIRAALYRRPTAVVCGLTAGRLLGFGALPAETADEPVHLLGPWTSGSPRPRRPAGLIPHWGTIPAEQVVDLHGIHGIRVTAAARTLADLVLDRERDEAVRIRCNGSDRRNYAAGDANRGGNGPLWRSTGDVVATKIKICRAGSSTALTTV
jgi:hypothetical protein